MNPYQYPLPGQAPLQAARPGTLMPATQPLLLSSTGSASLGMMAPAVSMSMGTAGLLPGSQLLSFPHLMPAGLLPQGHALLQPAHQQPALSFQQPQLYSGYQQPRLVMQQPMAFSQPLLSQALPLAQPPAMMLQSVSSTAHLLQSVAQPPPMMLQPVSSSAQQLLLLQQQQQQQHTQQQALLQHQLSQQALLQQQHSAQQQQLILHQQRQQQMQHQNQQHQHQHQQQLLTAAVAQKQIARKQLMRPAAVAPALTPPAANRAGGPPPNPLHAKYEVLGRIGEG